MKIKTALLSREGFMEWAELGLIRWFANLSVLSFKIVFIQVSKAFLEGEHVSGSGGCARGTRWCVWCW